MQGWKVAEKKKGRMGSGGGAEEEEEEEEEGGERRCYRWQAEGNSGELSPTHTHSFGPLD